jgi:hypothetical protein
VGNLILQGDPRRVISMSEDMQLAGSTGSYSC